MEPLTTSLLASAITSAVSAAAGEAGRSAWQRILVLLRERFGRPEPTGSPEEIAVFLKRLAQHNPVLAESLRDFCGQAGVPAVGGVGDPLPPDPPAYTNRRVELDWLSSAVAAARREGRAAAAILMGSPGVGVSALAVRFAHESAAEFPGGRIRVDLGEASLLDTLGVLLRWQGVPGEFIERSTQGRVVQLRRRVTEPMCVIVEGVTEPRQIEDLLPAAAGSVVIATLSRRPGVERGIWELPLRVPPLSDVHSAEMLRGLLDGERDEQRLAADPDGTRRLVELCGGLAQALRIAAVLLARRPAWTPTRLVDHLLARGASELTGLFDEAYAALTGPALIAYPMMCVMPDGDFTAEAVAAAAGMPLIEAEDALAELADAQLIIDLGARYHASRLIRAHAEQHCPDRSAASRRLVDWYVMAAYAADAAVMGDRLRVGPGAPAAGGIGWLIAERENILQTMRVAARTGCNDAVWQLAEACWALVFGVRLYSYWRTSGELGLAAAQRAGNPAAEVRMRQQLARLHLELGDFDEAEAQLDAAMGLATAIPERNRGSLLEFTGILRTRQGRLDEALAFFDEAEAVHDPGDPERRRDRAILLNQKAIALTRLDQLGAAESALTQALGLLADIGDERTSVRTLLLRGRLPGHQSDLVQALESATRQGLTAYEADALAALGREAEAKAVRERFGLS